MLLRLHISPADLLQTAAQWSLLRIVGLQWGGLLRPVYSACVTATTIAITTATLLLDKLATVQTAELTNLRERWKDGGWG